MNGVADLDRVWYLAQLRPNGEQLAERNLLRQGFEVFAPKMRRTRRCQGKFRDELRALFPGYLFVSACSHLARWRSIGSTLGVQRIVGFGGDGPSRVSSELIAGLKQRCDDLGKVHAPALSAGNTVRILSGPFAEFVGSVERIPSERRIWILLELIGRRVAVRPDQVELKAGEAKAGGPSDVKDALQGRAGTRSNELISNSRPCWPSPA